MRIASIDMGSNTTLMLIAEISDAGLKVIEDRSTVTRMGQEIAKTGRLHKEALARLDQCLDKYIQRIENLKVDRVVAVATSAARDATNSEALLEITDKYEIPVSVIPGEQEAEITYLGSTFDQPEPMNCLVIDIGGGSTEIVGRKKNDKVEGTSLDVGSVRLLDLFIKQHPVPESQLAAARKFVDDQLSKQQGLFNLAQGKTAVAVAGTPTTLAMLMQQTDFDENKIHGFSVDLKDVKAWSEKLAGLDIEQCKRLPGMPEKRADVMVAGSLILHRVLEKLGFDKLTVSTKGVRYGLALQAYKQASQ